MGPRYVPGHDTPGGGPLRAEFVVASSQGENLAPTLGRIKWTGLILLPQGDASRPDPRPRRIYAGERIEGKPDLLSEILKPLEVVWSSAREF